MASSHRRVGNNKNDNNKHNNNHAIFLLAAIFLIVLNLLSGSWSIQNNHQNILIHNYPNTDSEDDPIIVTNPKNSKYYRKDVNTDDVVVAKNDTDPIFAKYKMDNDKKHHGNRTLKVFLEHPKFLSSRMKPLPSRVTTPDDLVELSFPQVTSSSSCSNLNAQWPIDEAWPDDTSKESWTKHFSQSDFFINQDPFLPWIHDVFPVEDGSAVRVIAQNKRRCHTGDGFESLMKQMEPQIALFQGVPVKRIKSYNDTTEVRYALTSYDNADPDALVTRFICRISSDFDDFVYETVSRYLFNYEVKSIHKDSKMFTTKGKDNGQFWTSTLVFECPVPIELQATLGRNSTIRHDRASLFMDIIPIRTPTRTSHYIPKHLWNIFGNSKFEPDEEWGNMHVLPRVKASGRWENIPICPLSSNNDFRDKSNYLTHTNLPNKKRHELIACTWTSSSYKIRGRYGHTLHDGENRLLEWIEFHLLAGFDHIYVYDNSKAFNSTSSLSRVTDLFPEQVTRIDWPCRICNNFKPAFFDPGERSSQYAAEVSCLNRYGRDTEWLASMDIDEYLIPIKENNSIKDVIRKADDKGIKILTFGSLRSKLREDASIPFIDPKSKDCNQNAIPSCLVPKTTILQAYNCESVKLPKPDHAYRAQKQIYKPSYVKHHFVHYSTINEDNDRTKERKVDETKEAVLIHAKSVTPEQSKKRDDECKKAATCNVGYPWPNNEFSSTDNRDNTTGMLYNCFVNKDVEERWIPLLEDSLLKRMTRMGDK